MRVTATPGDNLIFGFTVRVFTAQTPDGTPILPVAHTRTTVAGLHRVGPHRSWHGGYRGAGRARSSNAKSQIRGTRMGSNRLLRSGAALAGSLTFAAPALATISYQFTPQPITATTDLGTPPPGIQGYQCYDLVVSITAGDPTRVATIYWDPPGDIFQNVFGTGAPDYGPPNNLLIPVFPTLAFDTYLQSFNGFSLSVIGTTTDGSDQIPGPGVFNNNKDRGGCDQLLRRRAGRLVPAGAP
jgi:hypothetical protein